MATRRRIGVSIASTEAARRQLMQPVACWERVWTTPENIPNVSFKVRRWARTEKPQQFSDDEDGADEPLAPLPDEPEVGEGDEEMEQEEQPANGAESAQPGTRAPSAPQEDTQPPSPKQPHLSLESVNDTVVDSTMDTLDAALNPEVGQTAGDEGIELALSGLEPDDLPLVSGPLMDQTEDEFAKAS
ncbi:hypothetical protein M378DRAFT_155337 [Amanita muscaria Koide BX008]|uniref:Uncharacterized protein n=1 Tax=Amanita muscaria (strain Koide BX008) TaxID=946122 RepID=A0A0C2TWC0_AMAMK|nr:hypothetical protein M378DRAFT_155337 [Amanita muscaria Koide BX008]